MQTSQGQIETEKKTTANKLQEIFLRSYRSLLILNCMYTSCYSIIYSCFNHTYREGGARGNCFRVIDRFTFINFTASHYKGIFGGVNLTNTIDLNLNNRTHARKQNRFYF